MNINNITAGSKPVYAMQIFWKFEHFSVLENRISSGLLFSYEKHGIFLKVSKSSMQCMVNGNSSFICITQATINMQPIEMLFTKRAFKIWNRHIRHSVHAINKIHK